MLTCLAVALAADPPSEAPSPALAAYWEGRLRTSADVVERDWSVLRGGVVLDARAFAAEVGDDETLGRIDRRRRAWRAVGVTTLLVGVPAGFLVPPNVFQEGPAGLPLTMVAVGGAVLVSAGSIGASVRLGKAPTRAFYDVGEAEALVERHNRALADELALDPSALE